MVLSTHRPEFYQANWDIVLSGFRTLQCLTPWKMNDLSMTT